jgi:aspartate racemase
MRAAADYAAERWPNMKKIGLLAAPATVKIGIYHRTFAEKGIEVIAPDEKHQEMTTQAIYAVKGGQTGPDIHRLAADAGEYLAAQGAEAVIAGCTEIPLILTDGDISVPVVDATWALAVAVVRFARGM